MDMKKTSVYLSEEDRERLKRLAERKGESQAWVLREALLAYDVAMPGQELRDIQNGRRSGDHLNSLVRRVPGVQRSA